MEKVQSVRAKFWVQTVQHHHQQDPNAVFATVTMAPVYDDANNEWSMWTPQGSISISITNPTAVAVFELGKQYFVDFTPVPAPENSAL